MLNRRHLLARLRILIERPGISAAGIRVMRGCYPNKVVHHKGSRIAYPGKFGAPKEVTLRPIDGDVCGCSDALLSRAAEVEPVTLRIFRVHAYGNLSNERSRLRFATPTHVAKGTQKCE